MRISFEEPRMAPTGPAKRDVDISQLDQQKVLVYGTTLFSSVIAALYPLSVIKTQQMASPHISPGLSGAMDTARLIWRAEGPFGFYRGFTTVLTGAFPACLFSWSTSHVISLCLPAWARFDCWGVTRMLYLPTVEISRDCFRKRINQLPPGVLSDMAKQSLANAMAGATASVISSAVSVPMDVISSRTVVAQSLGGAPTAGPTAAAHPAQQPSKPPAPGAAAPLTSNQPAMLAKGAEQRTQASERQSSRRGMSSMGSMGSGTGPRSGSSSAGSAQRGMSGLQMARHIVRTEGVLGLYRGLGMSLLTYTPASAMWWALYSAYQDSIWYTLYQQGWNVGEDDVSYIASVQALSATLSGCTNAVLTNPLDVIKTRLQIAGRSPETAGLSTSQVVRSLLQQEGIAGLWRGVVPRMANVALWSTAMVSTYELLKRMCMVED